MSKYFKKTDSKNWVSYKWKTYQRFHLQFGDIDITLSEDVKLSSHIANHWRVSSCFYPMSIKFIASSKEEAILKANNIIPKFILDRIKTLSKVIDDSNKLLEHLAKNKIKG